MKNSSNFTDKEIEELVARYSELVISFENQSCFHGGKVKSGKDFWDSGCGYYFEYINDLACRTNIQAYLDQELDLKKRERILKTLETLDSRFKKLLSDEEIELSAQEKNRFPKDRYWFEYHLPKGMQKP